MRRDAVGDARRWRAAVYLSSISSTFSTIVSRLPAARIRRDTTVDWMSIAFSGCSAQELLI